MRANITCRRSPYEAAGSIDVGVRYRASGEGITERKTRRDKVDRSDRKGNGGAGVYRSPRRNRLHHKCRACTYLHIDFRIRAVSERICCVYSDGMLSVLRKIRRPGEVTRNEILAVNARSAENVANYIYWIRK